MEIPFTHLFTLAMQPLQNIYFHEKGSWQILLSPQNFEKSLKTRNSSHRAVHEEDNPTNPIPKMQVILWG